jgi:hypothetical protein
MVGVPTLWSASYSYKSWDNTAGRESCSDVAAGCDATVLLLYSQEVVDELFEVLSSKQQDWQQLRAWVRTLQQHEQQQQEQQQQLDLQHWPQQLQIPPDAQQESVAAVAVQDPEVLQLIQELNAPQQVKQPGSGSGSSSKSKGKGGKSPASVARRSIRRMLKPLALGRL